SGSAVSFASLANGGGTIGAAGTNPRVFFNTGPGSGFLPWATVATNFFAFYNGDGVTTNGNGVQPLSAAAQVPLASAGPADHALQSGTGTLAAPTTVTSLQIASTATGQSLALGSN